MTYVEMCKNPTPSLSKLMHICLVPTTYKQGVIFIFSSVYTFLFKELHMIDFYLFAYWTHKGQAKYQHMYMYKEQEAHGAHCPHEKYFLAINQLEQKLLLNK